LTRTIGDRLVVMACASGMFAVIYSSAALAPLVAGIASDFSVGVATIGVVAAAYSVPGLVSGAITGPFSDRYGRRPFLAGGTALLGTGTIAAAFAQDVTTLAALRAVAGIGAAVIMPNSNAAIGDRFPAERRAQVFAVTFTSNVIGGLAGIWLTGMIAERYGWRTALVLAGVVALVATGASLAAPLGRAAASGASFLRTYVHVLGDRSAAVLLAANFLSATAWIGWTLFGVLFFERTYGLAAGAASTHALVFGGGLLLGSQLGARIPIRGRERSTLALSQIGFGLLLVAVTLAQPPLAFATAVLLAAATCYGFRATANLMLMTEQVPMARSTLFGLASTTIAGATATSGVLGGILVESSGFVAFAIFCLVTSTVSGLLVIGLVRDTAGNPETAPGPVG
jgi:DHA1 family inner membrane transport protein